LKELLSRTVSHTRVSVRGDTGVYLEKEFKGYRCKGAAYVMPKAITNARNAGTFFIKTATLCDRGFKYQIYNAKIPTEALF
jgi:hypothetical protein